jgi:hypothetical protein
MSDEEKCSDDDGGSIGVREKLSFGYLKHLALESPACKRHWHFKQEEEEGASRAQLCTRSSRSQILNTVFLSLIVHGYGAR